MTRDEVNQRYQIPMELLKEYEERALQKEKTDG